MTHPSAILSNVIRILHEPLPEAIQRALARLKLIDVRTKLSNSYWRRYY
jgi:hypothetical protein